MFLPLTGLSVFIHLTVIFTAMVINRVRGRGLRSAYQTYNKNGGLTHSQAGNRFISIAILCFVTLYMLALASVAIITAIRIGADEPQRDLYLYLFAVIAAHFGSLLILAMMCLTYYALRITHRETMSSLPNVVRRKVNDSIDALYETILRITMNTTHTYTNAYKIPLARHVATRGALGSRDLGKTREYRSTVGTSSMLAVTFVILVVAALFGAATPAQAQIVEPGFESEVVVDNLSLATAIAFTPDGRILIAEKGGAIKVVKNGVLLAEPLVVLTDVNTFGDRGLLGLAVDPNFAQNGYIYVSYTFENTPGFDIAGPKTGRIVRLKVEGDSASESSKFVLVGTVGGTADAPSCQDHATTADCIASDSNSHSVGGLRFGPDGKLYATLGDGADFVTVDPRALRAQNVDVLAGKMLRINTDGTAPSDNPFYNGSSTANRSKVYALGFRNAFRFNFNPVTGQLYAGDVGWGNWEEVNRVVAGANYGWPCREGNSATSYGCTPSSTATNPLYTYAHNSAGAGSITGGAFAKNGVYPASFNNSLFIGDYAQMWMKRLNLNAAGTSVVSVSDFNTEVFPVDIMSGPDGNIYYIDIVYGTLNRITHTSGNRRPVVQIAANPSSGLTPLNVAFSSVGTNDPDGNPLTYAWSFGDGATSSLANPSHVYTTSGSYTAALTVTDSLGSSMSKNTTITAGNQKPTAIITNPASGSLYNVGDSITVTGQGTDPENGSLAASRLSWQVILHHNTHTHTVYIANGTNSITFPADDHDAIDVYLEIVLTVTDSAGLQDSESINMYLNNGVGAGNLVSNPSMEIEGALAGAPHDWYVSWYGVMNPTFTYPVTGLAGEKAGRITVAGYQSGSAKWLFSPVVVTAGQTYTFSDLYTATVPTEVLVQLGKSDGTYEYLFLDVVPATSTPRRITYDFTVPAGIESATVFHELTSNGTLTVDDFSLTLAGTDTTPPSGSITSPTASSTVSGTVSVAVTATDNVGVASTQLVVDGVPVGVGDAEPPYANMLDTTALSNGWHTLFARITDTSGNVGDTAAITVLVSNGTTTQTNLIQNGNFETTGTGGNPAGWAPGGWGTHTAQYNYPITGYTGKAVEIVVTKYGLSDTGDARWMNAPVPLTQGTKYTYATMYKATTITDVLCRYRFANNSEHFFGLIKEIPPSATWKRIENSFVPPVGAVDVTCGHAISAETHSLAIDDVELYANGTGTPSEINVPTVDFVSPTASSTLSGVVTLTATSSDDTAVVGVFFAVNGTPIGVEDTTAPYQATLDTRTYPNGTYLLKATTRDPYGNNTSKTISVIINNSTTTLPTGSNLVVNPGLETAGTGGNPSAWSRGGWGTNTITYSYPVAGFTGNGAAVTVTNYSSGDAKWFFNAVAVTPGTQYTLSNRYKSTIPSQTFVRYTQSGGAFTYVSLDSLPTTGGAWQMYSKSLTPPAGVTHLTLFHVIAGNGTLTVDDASVTGPGATSTPDTTAPTVSITAPAASSTVSGTTTLTASASDNVGVAGVTFYRTPNSTPIGVEDTTAPYSVAWNTRTIANGSYSVLAVARDAAGNRSATSTVTVIVSNSTSTPDTTSPTASVTQPTSGAALTGTTTINANASDNVGVTSVSLLIDGMVVGSPDTTAPYSFAWNSATVGNGPHTVSVRAQDAAGNSTTSTAVSVTVNNSTTTPPTGNNLISNPALETAGTGGNPSAWSRGGWGTNTITYSYPVAGFTGNGAAVTVTNYSSGDAKWMFDSVAATPGQNFTFGYAYKATAPTRFVLRYTKTDNSFSYVDGPSLATAANWTNGTFNFQVPTGMKAVTVFHILAANGTLTIDNQSLTSGTATTTNTFSKGKVSFSFDDGWREHATIAAPVLDAAGLSGTFYIITDEMDNTTSELVSNGNLETPGAGGPAAWAEGGWGNNTRSYAYPVAGRTGNGAAVSISAYTDGDVKWFFNAVPVTPNTVYTVGDAYKSNAPTQLIVRYTKTGGAFEYQLVESLPATGDTWQTVSRTLTTPAGTTHLTLMHILNSVGTLTIDDATVSGAHLYATTDDVESIHNAGHEIGSHTKTHPSLTSLSAAAKTDEISGSRQVLINAGFGPVTTMAYPLGDYDASVKQAVIDAGYTAARSVDRGYNDVTADPYALKIQQVDRNTSLATMRGWIDQAAASKTWLILMFHQINNDTAAEYGITEANFRALVNHATGANVDVITVAEGTALLD